MYQSVFKRFFDVIISLTIIIILAPLMVFVIITLAFLNKGTPFFIQERPGKGEILFRVLKLKTMSDAMDQHGKLLSDSERLTYFGRIIRKTSLDEIPQLINVIKGDMSLIGPRPLLVKYMPFYTEEERSRHTVRPGITGLAQINGRNVLEWERRLGLDIEYVKNVTFLNDIRITVITIYKIFRSENVVVDPSIVMKDLDEERRVFN